MSYTPTMDELREAWLQAESEERDASTSDDDLRAEFDRALAAHDAEVRAGVIAEEPELPTSMKRFHGLIPGMLPLFHTYCSEHPDFGTCADEEQAHRDIADHLSAEHAALDNEGREKR
ncbi:hypothetical protein [Microbacterium maritypicum]|uniref:hypothetical protein n=1 Tax=Microbacterium maritypicum TaxID=33918 RepID=UPI003807ACEB